MKTFLFLLFCAFAASANALSQPSISGRRAFLSKSAAAAAAVAIASPAIAADQYSLDLDESYKKPAPEKKEGNGGTIVGATLGGGLLLSLPFFAPNLARMAGIKNTKLK